MGSRSIMATIYRHLRGRGDGHRDRRRPSRHAAGDVDGAYPGGDAFARRARHDPLHLRVGAHAVFPSGRATRFTSSWREAVPAKANVRLWLAGMPGPPTPPTPVRAKPEGACPRTNDTTS